MEATSNARAVEELRAAILEWYRQRGRALEFRDTRDAYAILVSEVMAQQTQIGRVVEHWRRFIQRFPTIVALADASPGDVLRAWSGLGYNRRALNLHRCARVVVEKHRGQLPADPAVLETLPGIGPYTARAVAALAFERPVAAVDVNVARVVSRITGASGVPRGTLQHLADGLVPSDAPREWTHAVMDLGATCCRVREPMCAACPALPWCRHATAATITPQRAPSRVRSRAAPPFHWTTRWLRGRIIDRLCATGGSDWVEVPATIGTHGEASVRRALRELAREGLIELRDTRERSARLPV